MSTLHFLNYNNYQNRTLKGEILDSTDDYTIVKSYPGINFNINDGIDTVQIINDSVLTSFNYDYCLVTDENSNTPKKILSKWFVHDAVWNRKHQWIIPLKRDVKADFYDMYKDKPFFCMKGLPSGTDDVLCFNAEGKEYNQILKNRIPLKQSSDQSERYIIGFVDKTWSGGKVIVENYAAKFDSVNDLPVAEIMNRGYFDEYVGATVRFTAVKQDKDTWFTDTAGYATHRGDSCIYTVPCDTSETPEWTQPAIAGTIEWGQSDIGIDPSDPDANFRTLFLTAIGSARNEFATLKGYIDEELKPLYGNYEEIKNFLTTYNNLPIRIGDTIYTFSFNTNQQPSDQDGGNNVLLGSSQKQIPIYRMQSSNREIWWTQNNTDSMCGDCKIKRYTFSCTTRPLETLGPFYFPVGLTTKNPYHIFVIPDSTYARQFATWFAATFGGAQVLYDLQLFPYAPPYSYQTRITPDQASTHEYMYWATSDSAFGDCYHPAIATYTSMADKKVGANQHMCRLIAPNGSSAWEFNPATIGGVPASSTSHGIKYEFTLIPFNSYLHIFPYFMGIYGGINKVATDKVGETRGLVCSGPWSLPYSTNNWTQYQIQNSAYQDSFNRQIQNMTTVQDIEKKKEAANIILGSLQAGASGAATGAMVSGGNPYAAAIAGGVSMVATAAGGMTDQYLNSKLREETINYTKDQFQNSLQNIKAQPQPLAHNSSITIGNSYWPILEFYTADVGTTPTPMRDYFLADLKIHGWTMGITTTFATMKSRVSNDSRYISGYLLQIENAEDTHIANEVMKELNKGVYIDHV